MILEDPNEVIMSPVIFTEIINREDAPEHDKLFKLQDLFLHYDQIPEDLRKQNDFKVRFTTYRFDPKEDTREAVQSMCPKCKVTKSCKELNAKGEATCVDCNVDCKLIWQV